MKKLRVISTILIFVMLIGSAAYASPFNNGQKVTDANTQDNYFLQEIPEDEIFMKEDIEKTSVRDDNGNLIYNENNFPTPKASHPRLYVTRELLPLIRSKASRPDYKDAWEHIIRNSEMKCDGTLPNVAENYNSDYLRYIEANSFRYLMCQDKTKAEKAIAAMNNFLLSYNPPSSTGYNYNEIGSVLVTLAIVYDWCYDVIPQFKKYEWIDIGKNLASKTSMGYPPTKMGLITGHGSESQLIKDQLSLGTAIYDECPDMYNYCAKRIFDEFIPSRDFSNPSQFFHQGMAYAAYRTQFDIYPVLIYDRMGYTDILTDDFRKMCYSYMYYRRPDGNVLEDGDHGSQFLYEYTQAAKLIMLAASYYKDPYLMEEFKRGYHTVLWDNYPWDGSYISPVEYMLFYDDQVGQKSISELPLTYYYPSPIGAMIARTGWDNGINSKTAIAMMKIGEYFFANHAHHDAGDFDIYYGGNLVGESGLYKGKKGGYSSDHNYNYYKRTIAHNTMLVYDPDETFFSINRKLINDGGQRLPSNRAEVDFLDELLNKDYKVSDVLSHWYGPYEDVPDYSYLKGDLTNAYSDKVEKFLRSFVFLNLGNDEYPAAFIVYDKVAASNPAFQKSFLLHSIEEPEVAGNVTTIKRTEDGFNGKLENTTILPTEGDLEISKIGGENKYNVNGTTFPNTPDYPPGKMETTDAWQIFINPKINKKTDYFLNVIQVMDNENGPQPVPVERLINAKTVGVKLHDRVVLFSSNGESIDGEFSFDITGNELYKTLVCDMKEGTYGLFKNGEYLYDIEVLKDQGSLYFEGEAGRYTVKSGSFGNKTGSIAPKRDIKFNDQTETSTIVNRKNTENNTILFMEDGSKFVPLRSVMDVLGFTTTWDSTTNVIKSADLVSKFQYDLNNNTAIYDGKTIHVSYEPIIKEGTTFVNVRFFEEVMLAQTMWNDYARVMQIIIPRPKVFDVKTEVKYPNQIAVKKIISSSDDGNEAINTIDGTTSTRWSSNGDGQWVLYDFGENITIDKVGIAWHNGSIRKSKYDLLVSKDGENWETVFSGESGGISTELEYNTISAENVRYLKLIGYGNDNGGGGNARNPWNSPSEVIAFK